MSFSTSNRAERGPSVIALFEFKVSETDYYYYTDADEEVIVDEKHYTPTQISYNDLVADGTLKSNPIDIETSIGLAPIKLFRVEPPSFECSLTIYEGHAFDRQREFQRIWTGVIHNCKIAPPKATLSCKPQSTKLARTGLTRHYQRPCPHVVYGPLCKATRVEQNVNWLAGTTNNWIVSKPGSGYKGRQSYEGGLVMWVDGAGFERVQTILSVAETPEENLSLRVNQALAPTVEPVNVRIVRGCNHTETACIDWHDNIANFGGCPFIPVKSPLKKFSEYY